MAIVIDIGVAELAATRFAISPLGETVCALLLLGRPGRVQDDSLLEPWVNWARAVTQQGRLTLPTVWPLLVNHHSSFPEFLAPAPMRSDVSLEQELAVLVATRPDQVRSSLRRVLGSELAVPASGLARHPAPGLRRIAVELSSAHSVLIEPNWPRMQALLAADIGHRARLQALGGTKRLLAELAPDTSWDRGRLAVSRPGPDQRVTLGSRGLVLVPTTLVSQTQLKRNSSTQIVLRYRPRGVAALFERTPDALPPRLARLIGAPRARLMESLRSPASTGQLAADMGVTSSAVSQHLTVLRGAGLVTTIRSGRGALHELSAAGIVLLDAPHRQ